MQPIECLFPNRHQDHALYHQTIPETIFHYTSPHGLYGILQENTLRFTDCQFMNDVSEYIHIRKPFRIALESLQEELNYPYFSEIATSLFEHVYSDEELDAQGNEIGPFITTFFCTSLVPDSLGMWNHYVKSKDYQGYSIGFQVDCLLESFRLIHPPGVQINHGKVLYKEEEQVDLLLNTLRETDQEITQISNGMESVLWEDPAFTVTAENILKSRLDEFRLFFKDESFADEREYRLVLKLSPTAEEKFEQILLKGYSVKNGVFVPHVDLKFSKENAIRSIMVAPMVEFQLAKIGLLRFLHDYDYASDIIEINQSMIPIRY